MYIFPLCAIYNNYLKASNYYSDQKIEKYDLNEPYDEECWQHSSGGKNRVPGW